MLVDAFLPIYDVSDAVAMVVEADTGVTWDALRQADLLDLGRRPPAVAVLGAHVLVQGLLERTREIAEGASGP